MKYSIKHWRGKQPPVPEAILVEEATEKYATSYEVEIEDIHEFVKIHGSIRLYPPGKHGANWFIWVTDGDKWHAF